MSKIIGRFGGLDFLGINPSCPLFPQMKIPCLPPQLFMSMFPILFSRTKIVISKMKDWQFVNFSAPSHPPPGLVPPVAKKEGSLCSYLSKDIAH